MVKNPSFEVFVDCPKNLGNFNIDVADWSTPTEGSTDYFNGCSTAMGTPKNFNGSQLADFGVGYAGFYLYAPDDYREYLQGSLKETLVKDKTYRISFYVSLAERSDFAIKDFGVVFSKDSLSFKTKKELSKNRMYQDRDNEYNYVEIAYSNFYSDTQDWKMVYTQFVAKGSERYILLGNFKNNAQTRMFRTKKNAKQGAYYYLDMISVEALDGPITAQNTMLASKSQEISDFEINTTHVFQNVLFEFDRSQLMASAEKELGKIFDYLNQNVDLNITINGHTDTVGSAGYNQLLSAERAKTVAEFLIDLGLAKDRISWAGYGGERPLASNDTEMGRQQNRRVEFVITKTPL
ncbi:MAG: OmpA family protein [Maribacter sp.]|nr:OmpA family protein [Maribacter sp.]